MNYLNLIIVLGLIVLDFVTGILKAVKTSSFSSTKMREGIYNKVGEILTMIVMYALEYAMPIIGINVDLPLVKVMTVYICIMEIGSLFENLGAINPALAGKLSAVFEAFEKKEE